ncbi:FCD domain-containing protein [Petroclostridium sp. X23]|uniref:FCD domain-containing protein n=1 Tax=Petroclostridium sp. X23 TaxID=3045146 RepID=UPI0024ACA9DE|nr:FCD domain-containing protein [Petroclostridium sp. X23]WHH61238.1 FCD domain-containing protein [Petroclostridium sp. X23]
MKNGANKKNRMMQTGVFKTQSDMLTYLLAKSISQKEKPVGSWALKAELDTCGIDCSTATIGRYLKLLDTKEYTLLCSNQGRVLTPGGVAWLNMMDERLARAQMRNEAAQNIKVNEYADLIDLLRARKAIEIEAARLAALYATDEEIATLRKSIEQHYSYVAENRDPVDPALEFHAIVSEISHNKFIKAMLSMLIFEEKQIESSMETLLTRERGSIYVIEHDKITSALEARNPQHAADLMQMHLEAILSAVKEQVHELEEFYGPTGMKT